MFKNRRPKIEKVVYNLMNVERENCLQKLYDIFKLMTFNALGY